MKPLEKMTFEELVQMLVELKEDINDSEKIIADVRKELFKRFDEEVGDGPIFMLYYPSDLESNEDIKEYFKTKHPGALIHKIDENEKVVYGYFPAEYQKSVIEVKDVGKVERRISNTSPKLNLNKLKTLDPVFYSKVVRQEDVFDDEKFGAILADDPSSVPEAFEQCIEGAKPKISLHITDFKQ